MTLKVSDIGEKELVRYIIANSKDITPDDTAITELTDSNLISTCDMLIQSRHFPKNMSYFDMGFKSVTVNVSDLAAMGAEPLGFLLSIAIPKDLDVDSFKQIIEGVLSACDYVCRQHKNINGELFDESYRIVSSLSPDPIEKKPLNHFLPGTLTYSIGGFGCNMTCLHCQNYMISQEYDKNERGIKITPEAIVENALKYNCKSIVWTYNEPTIHLPFTKKTSLLARRENLKVIYVSNGYFFRQVS